MDPVEVTIEQLYKSHFGKLVASLLYLSKDIDIATAEDLVQEAFSAALVNWHENGIPTNAPAWLYTVCKNKALNTIRKFEKNATLLSTESVEAVFPELNSPLSDQQLRLLFMCAHPDLAPKSQVAITLKYVVSLKVEAIARLLGMTVDGVDKILIRARDKIRSANLLHETTDTSVLKSRLPIIHKIIYLIFNEGHRSSWGREVIREELCEEALILNNCLLTSGLSNKETMALHALMLFNSARIKSRFNADGEIVELENQDRSLWNADLIALGKEFLHRSEDDIISTYHLEASVSYLHCSASSFELTRWPLIVKMYQQLLRQRPNPFVELNYAIALYYSGDSRQAFHILGELQRHAFLHEYFPLTATLGKLHMLEGHHDKARDFLLRAQKQTNFTVEKNHIKRMISSM